MPSLIPNYIASWNANSLKFGKREEQKPLREGMDRQIETPDIEYCHPLSYMRQLTGCHRLSWASLKTLTKRPFYVMEGPSWDEWYHCMCLRSKKAQVRVVNFAVKRKNHRWYQCLLSNYHISIRISEFLFSILQEWIFTARCKIWLCFWNCKKLKNSFFGVGPFVFGSEVLTLKRFLPRFFSFGGFFSKKSYVICESSDAVAETGGNHLAKLNC